MQRASRGVLSSASDDDGGGSKSAMREQGTSWWARAVKLTDGPGVSAVDHCLQGIVVAPRPAANATCSRARSSYVGASTSRKMPIGARCRTPASVSRDSPKANDGSASAHRDDQRFLADLVDLDHREAAASADRGPPRGARRYRSGSVRRESAG